MVVREHARVWGAMKHQGQVRKFTGEEYFTHCVAVADLVDEYWQNCYETPAPDEVYAAALLHDVVEDTDATLEDVQENFGETVAKYVYFLTKPPEFAGNRAERKALFNRKLAVAPNEAKLIKFFDFSHNSTSMAEHDPDFFVDWSKEVRTSCQEMTIWSAGPEMAVRSYQLLETLINKNLED